MEKATSSIRRGGALLWSIGAGYQQLNLIISELKNLRSHTKAIRDSQTTVLQDMTNWAFNDESRALNEMFVHLLDLNTLWCEVQTQFADHINDFKHLFEMILEGEKGIDAARNKFADCEVAEQKARKKLKKIQKKETHEDVVAVRTKIAECERQREIAQAEVSEKVKENEAVKLIRVKEGLLKLSEAYLALSHKCIYIFEAQRDIVRCLPDIEDKEIHEVRFDGLMGGKEILDRARTLVKDYRNTTADVSSPQPRNSDPPPPYYAPSCASPFYPPSPYQQPFYSPSPYQQPFYSPPGAGSGSPSVRDQQTPEHSVPQPPRQPVPASCPPADQPNTLYPTVNGEDLVTAMSSASIRHGT